MDGEPRRGVIRQFVFCLLAYLPAIAPSCSLGFSAVVIPVFKDKTNITVDEVSWIASSAALSTPFGCLIAGLLADLCGRIGALLIVNVVSLIAWTILTVAYYLDEDLIYTILIIGRVITGFSTGLVSISPIYMAETSSTKLRPIFTTSSSMFYSLGIFIVYVYGYIFKDNWGLIAAFCMIYPIVSIFLTIFFLPETPAWLITKGKIEKAKKNMAIIYGKSGESLVEDDVNALVENYETQKLLAGNRRIFMSFFADRMIYCPFFIMLIYFFIQQFSGVMVVVFYAIDIANNAKVTLDGYLTIFLLALARVLTSLFVSLISYKYGRRITSFISGVGVVVTMYGLAIFVILQVHVLPENSPTYGIPVVLIVLYIILSTYGYLTVPFGMVAEVFPLRVRGFMVGFTIALCYFMCFIATKIYPVMDEYLENYWIFIVYGTVGLCGIVFLVIFLPETKGKTLKEIEDYFQKRDR